MHFLLVNKDGSHINKSDIPLLSAFLDLIKQYHGIKQVWFDATFDFSNSRFFEPISISLGGSKNRNSIILSIFYPLSSEIGSRQAEKPIKALIELNVTYLMCQERH